MHHCSQWKLQENLTTIWADLDGQNVANSRKIWKVSQLVTSELKLFTLSIWEQSHPINLLTYPPSPSITTLCSWDLPQTTDTDTSAIQLVTDTHWQVITQKQTYLPAREANVLLSSDDFRRPAVKSTWSIWHCVGAWQCLLGYCYVISHFGCWWMWCTLAEGAFTS